MFGPVSKGVSMDKTMTILKISFSSSICRQKLVVFWSARKVQIMYREQRAVGSRRCKSKIRGA
jgi:hypothetical protein